MGRNTRYTTPRSIFSERLEELMTQEVDEIEGFVTKRSVKKTSRKELAEAIGVSRQTIGYYLTGQNKPEIEKVVEIAKYFNVTTDWLLGVEGATRSTDKSIQAICEATVLNEHSAYFLSRKTIEEAAYSQASPLGDYLYDVEEMSEEEAEKEVQALANSIADERKENVGKVINFVLGSRFSYRFLDEIIEAMKTLDFIKGYEIQRDSNGMINNYYGIPSFDVPPLDQKKRDELEKEGYKVIRSFDYAEMKINSATNLISRHFINEIDKERRRLEKAIFDDEQIIGR